MTNWWDRTIAPRLIRCACGQPQIMKARSHVVPLASGDVFELGCGGGINLPFYDAAKVTSLSGIDPNKALLADTQRLVAERGFPADIRDGVGEDIPFTSASFDTVVTTFTLCSVQDSARVLSEIRRILKPGGTALFLEHGRAPDEAVRKWQRRIEPVWKHIGGGCHLTRPITQAYADAGFKTEQMGSGYMPKTPRPFGWLEWGVARV
ncbi:MAG: class I SAM-dependent methyltransferase [Sphingopyxis sp.]